jgi:DNA-binding FadR family transcriptional regulator
MPRLFILMLWRAVWQPSVKPKPGANMLALFDQLNAIRRTVVWGRLRDESASPPPDHHSFDQHDDIATAIRERDQDAAANTMWLHLKQVGDRLVSHNAGQSTPRRMQSG